MAVGEMRTTVARWITADDSLAARRLRSRVGGALFVVGTLLDMAAIIVQPGWADLHHGVILAVGVASLIGGIVLSTTAVPLSAVTSYVILTLAMASTPFAQAMVGASTTAGQAIGLIYVWVAVCAALYCRAAAAAVQVVLAGVAQAVALVLSHTDVWFPQWVMTFGTCAVMATVVNRLSFELRRRAYTDALTGVANRRSLMLRLGQEIEDAARHGTPLSVLLIDLDKFKDLNDELGHATGDAALIACAKAWKSELRAQDELARLGGDEFFAVLPGCDCRTAQPIAERMAAALPRLAIPLVCSVGMTEFRVGDTADSLLHRADRAMYSGKAAGGNSVIHDDATSGR